MFSRLFKKQTNVLVLGFYHRQNLGDDTYQWVIPQLFQDQNFLFNFQSLDDITEIPAETHFIICGGGDIINPYFMDKLTLLIKDYLKPVYALSVGFDESNRHYLNLFEHVHARSQEDYRIASQEIGNQNVTHMLDIAFYLSNPSYLPRPINVAVPLRIGLCLAQPYFWKNPHKDLILNNLKTSLQSLGQTYPNFEIHLLSFNYQTKEPSESDVFLNRDLLSRFNQLEHGLTCRMYTNLDNVKSMLDHFKTLDLVICSRYHAIIYSLITKVRFVALSSTPKNQRVIVKISVYLIHTIYRFKN